MCCFLSDLWIINSKYCVYAKNALFILIWFYVNKLSGIQYQALKIISKERGPVSNTYLHDLYGIETFDLRLHDLSSKYIENAFKRQNPLISDLLNNPFFTSKFLRSPFNLIGFIDQIT